jgi:hypothetical protein
VRWVISIRTTHHLMYVFSLFRIQIFKQKMMASCYIMQHFSVDAIIFVFDHKNIKKHPQKYQFEIFSTANRPKPAQISYYFEKKGSPQDLYIMTLNVVRLVFWHRRLYKVFQRRKTMQGHDIQITTTEPNHSSSGFQFPLCFQSVWFDQYYFTVIACWNSMHFCSFPAVPMSIKFIIEIIIYQFVNTLIWRNHYSILLQVSIRVKATMVS